jgi:hypothetical protein
MKEIRGVARALLIAGHVPPPDSLFEGKNPISL